jgi:ABC-type uncharacterized transport system substrate-binding protein
MNDPQPEGHMASYIRRRKFLATLLGGAAAAWPIAARGQQVGSSARIGLLWPGDAPPVPPRMESFRQGLRASGFIDGQNLAIELRYAQRGLQQLAELAAELIRLKVDVLPAIYQWKEHAEVGGLVSYGPNLAAMWRQAATITAKVLKGAKPADMPVEQPTKFELVVNLRTAKSLDLTIPPSILLRADEVIE